MTPLQVGKGLACLAALAWSAFGHGAFADPCAAIPDKGPMPSYLEKGASFSGQVVYVVDGDGICVAVGKGAQSWVEVRVADFYAPELSEPGGQDAKRAMHKIAFGKRVTCVAEKRSYDRVVALCTLNGASLSRYMRSAGVHEGGRGRR